MKLKTLGKPTFNKLTQWILITLLKRNKNSDWHNVNFISYFFISISFHFSILHKTEIMLTYRNNMHDKKKTTCRFTYTKKVLHSYATMFCVMISKCCVYKKQEIQANHLTFMHINYIHSIQMQACITTLAIVM